MMGFGLPFTDECEFDDLWMNLCLPLLDYPTTQCADSCFKKDSELKNSFLETSVLLLKVRDDLEAPISAGSELLIDYLGRGTSFPHFDGAVDPQTFYAGAPLQANDSFLQTVCNCGHGPVKVCR